MELDIEYLFKEPKFVGVIADPNEGKSNLLYGWIKRLSELNNKPKIYVYGLRKDVPETIKINSIRELETIENSIVLIDEFVDLIKLDEKNKKEAVERTIRLIYHHNNVIILSGLPENFNKFISSKLGLMVFKKITLDDAIKGSRVWKWSRDYNGSLRGSEILAVPKGQAIVCDGKTYELIDCPYLQEFDTKLDNPPIVPDQE